MPEEQYITCYLCARKNRIPETIPRTSGVQCGVCGALLIDIVSCSHCGTKNRVEIRLIEHQRIRCGRCQAILDNYRPEQSLPKTPEATYIMSNVLCIEGKLHQWKGEWETAIYLFRQAMKYSSNAPETIIRLSVSIGLCHAYLGNYERAVEYLDPIDVSKLPWTEFTMMYELARAYGLIGNIDRAIAYFEKARTLLTDQASEDNFAILLVSLRKIRDTSASSPFALQICILLYDAMRDYETNNFLAGVKKLQCALALDPMESAIYHQLGIGLVRQQQYKQAIDLLERGLALNASHEQAQFALGNAYFHLAMYDQALEAYKKTLHLNPHNIDAYYHLGLVYEKQGEIEIAKEYWEDVLKVNPTHEEALRSLERYSQ